MRQRDALRQGAAGALCGKARRERSAARRGRSALRQGAGAADALQEAAATRGNCPRAPDLALFLCPRVPFCCGFLPRAAGSRSCNALRPADEVAEGLRSCGDVQPSAASRESVCVELSSNSVMNLQITSL